MSSYLPQSEGLLPWFVLLVGVTAIGNGIQCYLTLSYTRRLYPGQSSQSASKKSDAPTSTIQAATNNSPATPLSSRAFGTWTIAVGIVRMFAAYHLNEASWYHMQMLTNAVGLVHFGLEAFLYKTSKPYGPWLAPVSVALIGTIWSTMQYQFYVNS